MAVFTCANPPCKKETKISNSEHRQRLKASRSGKLYCSNTCKAEEQIKKGKW